MDLNKIPKQSESQWKRIVITFRRLYYMGPLFLTCAYSEKGEYREGGAAGLATVDQWMCLKCMMKTFSRSSQKTG